jgi:3-oxoacyl-[acyl-carrier-protein] synthase-3
MQCLGQQHFRISGTGSYLPEVIVLAEEMDLRLGKPVGYVANTGGVLTRHECRSPETLASMAIAASHAAVASANLRLSDLDLIIDASTCRHQPIPCNAALLSKALGTDVKGTPAFDIQSTCLGFIVALQVANGLFATGSYEHVLIVCSESLLAGVNYSEPESSALMGDGAGAVVLSRAAPRDAFAYSHETHAEHSAICEVRGGSHNLPPFEYDPSKESLYRFHMDGPELFRVARKLLPPMVERMLEATKLHRDELQFIPHQASPRGVEAIRRSLGVGTDSFHNRTSEIGNLASASIPVMLDWFRRRPGRSQPVLAMLLGTSAGYSQAAMILEV